MKLVTAIIKPHKLDAVMQALAGADFDGLTASEVRGFGQQKGGTDDDTTAAHFLPKVKIEIATTDDKVDDAIKVISKAAKTEHIGDGKIFVTPMERVIRIRTGEEDQKAL